MAYTSSVENLSPYNQFNILRAKNETSALRVQVSATPSHHPHDDVAVYVLPFGQHV
jgi:hypothetical protein